MSTKYIVGMRLKMRHPKFRMQDRYRFVVTRVDETCIYVRQTIAVFSQWYLLSAADYLFVEVSKDDKEKGGFYW